MARKEYWERQFDWAVKNKIRQGDKVILKKTTPNSKLSGFDGHQTRTRKQYENQEFRVQGIVGNEGVYLDNGLKAPYQDITLVKHSNGIKLYKRIPLNGGTRTAQIRKFGILVNNWLKVSWKTLEQLAKDARQVREINSWDVAASKAIIQVGCQRYKRSMLDKILKMKPQGV